MKENLEDILKEKMSGYAEKAPDLRQSIFDKMDARMSGEEFESAVRNKMEGYSVKAPNLMERIFATRDSWFIAVNRLVLAVERYRYAIFTLVAATLLWTSYHDYSGHNEIAGNHDVITENDGSQSGQNTITTSRNGASGSASAPVPKQHDIAISSESAETPTNGNISAFRSSESIGTNRTAAPTVRRNDFSEGAGEIPSSSEVDDPRIGVNGISPDNGLAVTSDLMKVDQPAVEGDNSGQPGDSEGEKQVEGEAEQDLPIVLDKSDIEVDPGNGVTDPVVKTIRPYNFELFYAPAFAGRTLEGPDAALMSARNNSESILYSYGTGIRFNYELKPRWEFQTGLEFNRRREYVDFSTYTNVEEMDITSRTVIYKHPVLPDREVTIYDTAYSSYSVRADHHSLNRYSSVTVPLLFRYTVYSNNSYGLFRNFGFYMNGGLKLSIWNQQKGYVSNAAYELQDINEGVYSSRIFRPSFQLGMGTIYNINSRWSLIAEPSVVYGLRTVSTGSYGLDQFDFSNSLILGARLNF